VSFRLIVALGLLAVFLGPVRSEDLIKEAQEANSPVIKSSSDHRIKVTLLYVGPVNDPQIHQPFVIVYMVEDRRSEADLREHPWQIQPGNQIDSKYYLAPASPELKDSTGHLVIEKGPERARTYDVALMPMFKKVYPQLTLPAPDRPEKTGVYEYFYKIVPPGPFEITLHDSIEGYGKNNFHFRDIDTKSFPSN